MRTKATFTQKLEISTLILVNSVKCLLTAGEITVVCLLFLWMTFSSLWKCCGAVYLDKILNLFGYGVVLTSSWLAMAQDQDSGVMIQIIYLVLYSLEWFICCAHQCPTAKESWILPFCSQGEGGEDLVGKSQKELEPTNSLFFYPPRLLRHLNLWDGKCIWDVPL